MAEVRQREASVGLTVYSETETRHKHENEGNSRNKQRKYVCFADISMGC